MRRLITGKLLLCATYFCLSSDAGSGKPVYLNLGEVLKFYHMDDKTKDLGPNQKEILEEIIKTSDRVALKIGGSFVYYWQPLVGTEYRDITPLVIREMHEKYKDKK